MNQPSSATDPEKENRLHAIIAEYLKRKDAGKNVNKDKILKAYPDLADGLRSYFSGEALMDAASPAFAPTKLSPKPLPSDSRETVKPGAMESDTASEFESKRFGRYQLLRPLGEGAMGSVYLALDTTLDRQVALKVPKTEGTSNAEFMARFSREAKAAAGLKHPNICSVFDAGEHEGTAFITMDYIDGVPLSRFIGSRKLQSVESILQMITIIAEAVGHAHSKGVIHRDLKPGNILIDKDFKPHVTDFGLARRTGPVDESRITQEGLLIGTPAYMAPEQVKGEQSKVGPESDIYSLGVILFELLTARLPFEGKVAEMLAKVLRDNPPVPSHIRKDLSENIDDICLKMLKKEPGQRYSSMSQVIAAITKLPKDSISKTSTAAANETRSQSPFEIQKAHVEVMLKKGQYAAAIQELEKLAAEKSPGAKAVGDWARVTLPAARAESKALSPAGLAALLQTGQQMFEKSDYLGCIQLLEDVPSLRRTEAMEDLLAKARKRETDAEQLLSDIKDMERRQQIDGLESLVKRFLKLKPGNSYAKRLWEALHTYSKTPATRRKYRYEKGRLQPMPEASLLQQWLVLGLLVGVLTFLSVSYYVIIYLKSGNQTLAVHVDDEWLKSRGGELTLVVDGNDHTITAPSNGGEPLTVTVTLGEHSFSVKHGDTVVHDPKSFDIEKDGRKVLSITAFDIRLENRVPVTQPASEPLASSNDKPAVIPEPQTQATEKVEWFSLFDGTDVSRWSSLGPYQVENGLLISKRGQARTSAVSSEEYDDFELEAEWRITAGANGGIFYREAATMTGAGNEYQLIDPKHPQLNKASQKTGALYGIVPPSEDAERSVGDWNTTKIVCRGSAVEHWLNGKKVVQYDTTDPGWKGLKNKSELLSGKEQIGTKTHGHILLNWQSGEVAFRSIRIREFRTTTPGVLPDDTESFEGHSYKFFNESLTWSEAKTKCESLNGHLPIVETAAENDFIVKLTNKNFAREGRNGREAVWLGMSDIDSEGKWRWVDGRPVAYKNWSKSQPNNKGDNEHYGMLWLSTDPTHPTGQWSDQPNKSEQHVMAYICEWDTQRPQVSYPTIDVEVPNPSLKNCSQVHGATKKELIAWFNGLPNGYRPNWISVQADSTTPYFNAVAIQSASTEVYDLQFLKPGDAGDSALFGEKRFERTIVAFSLYKDGDNFEQLVVWGKAGSSQWWHGPHDFVNSKVQEGSQERSELPGTSEAMLPVAMIGNALDGQEYQNLVQDWLPVRQCVAEFGMNADALQKTMEEYRARDWTPHIVNATNSSDPIEFSAVFFDNPAKESWEFSPRLTTNEYRKKLAEMDIKKHQPRCVISYEESGVVGYTVVWEYSSIPSVAVMKDSEPVSANPNQGPMPVVVPFSADQAAKYQEAWASDLKLPVEYTNALGMKFRLIPPGKFTMGSTPEEIAAAKPKLNASQDEARPGRIESEGPPQIVTLTRPFYLGITEVTQLQYKTVVGANPSWYSPDGKGKDTVGNEDRSNAPVESLTWMNTGEFCNRLSFQEKLASAYRITPDLISQTGSGGYRLPTEAEWEFACRAGTNTLFSSGDDDESLKTIAWFSGNNTNEKPNPVGELLPNPFGLFDMHGNAWEQVHDAWRPDSYQRLTGAAAVDPREDVGVESRRVVRGGSHWMSSAECRSACRDVVTEGSHWGATGFRVALSVDAVRQLQIKK